MIALLRRHGADPLAPNTQGVTPAALAETIANYPVRRWFADVLDASRAAEPIEMVVDDLFRLQGRGTVIVGILRSGEFKVGDVVTVTRPDGMASQARVVSIEFHTRPGTAGFVLDPHDDAFVLKGSLITSRLASPQ
jgi:hypothetical protein